VTHRSETLHRESIRARTKFICSRKIRFEMGIRSCGPAVKSASRFCCHQKQKGGSRLGFLLFSPFEREKRLADRGAAGGCVAGGVGANHTGLVREEAALTGDAYVYGRSRN